MPVFLGVVTRVDFFLEFVFFVGALVDDFSFWVIEAAPRAGFECGEAVFTFLELVDLREVVRWVDFAGLKAVSFFLGACDFLGFFALIGMLSEKHRKRAETMRVRSRRYIMRLFTEERA